MKRKFEDTLGSQKTITSSSDQFEESSPIFRLGTTFFPKKESKDSIRISSNALIPKMRPDISLIKSVRA
jgi:hypothetical protein